MKFDFYCEAYEFRNCVQAYYRSSTTPNEMQYLGERPTKPFKNNNGSAILFIPKTNLKVLMET